MGETAHRGDAPRDFEAFYRAEVRAVTGLVYGLCGSWAPAEDLAQEAFVRTYRDWSRVAGMERPGAWVRRVAINLAVSRGRRLGAEARALARLRGRRDPQPDPLPPDDEAFWTAVRSLPRRQAQAVVLHYHADLAITDVAEAMGCAEGTAKAHLHHARRTLAARLAGRAAAAGEAPAGAGSPGMEERVGDDGASGRQAAPGREESPMAASDRGRVEGATDG